MYRQPGRGLLIWASSIRSPFRQLVWLVFHGDPFCTGPIGWCADQVPEHARGEIRIECDLAPRHLTICECRPPWREDFGPDWTRFPIARLHYTKTTGLWTLYWRDRNQKYHRYEPLDPSPQVQDLLDYLDTRADPIFWG